MKNPAASPKAFAEAELLTLEKLNFKHLMGVTTTDSRATEGERSGEGRKVPCKSDLKNKKVNHINCFQVLKASLICHVIEILYDTKIKK